jgi:hypothetical protein
VNDDERKLWVLNDETLYLTWKGARKNLTAFVRENRAELDKHINAVLRKEDRA